MRVLITGGAGFIGTHLLLRWVPRAPQHTFLNVDALTYAADQSFLSPLDELPHYRFELLDLADPLRTLEVVDGFGPDLIFHLAAESHVDRSIHSPSPFLTSNVLGTYHLLEACRHLAARGCPPRLIHVSTDEVYGPLDPESPATREGAPYAPSSPYSASKAAADHLVRAWHTTFGLPILLTVCSNNYGPRQFPEKLIPLMIVNALEDRPLPLYGDGLQVRDWLHVEDHVDALWRIGLDGTPGQTYHIASGECRTNLTVVEQICAGVEQQRGLATGTLRRLITPVADRPGHDRRYALDASLLRSSLGWRPAHSFEQGLAETIAWVARSGAWLERVRTGAHQVWLKTQYGGLLEAPSGEGRT